MPVWVVRVEHRIASEREAGIADDHVLGVDDLRACAGRDVHRLGIVQVRPQQLGINGPAVVLRLAQAEVGGGPAGECERRLVFGCSLEHSRGRGDACIGVPFGRPVVVGAGREDGHDGHVAAACENAPAGEDGVVEVG